LARAFNTAPNGFVRVDAQGEIVAANAELHRMSSQALDTLAGKAVEMLLPEAQRNMHIGLRTGFFEHPEPRLMGAWQVLYASHTDRHEFPVEIGLDPLAGPHGPLVMAWVSTSASAWIWNRPPAACEASPARVEEPNTNLKVSYGTA
jgi:PAS domain S-box-containing protein